MLTVRRKTRGDASACVALALAVHLRDGYPRYWPDDPAAFMQPNSQTAAWVADLDGEVVGHVGLHRSDGDPALASALEATRLPKERIAVVARLVVAEHVRHRGVATRLLAAAETAATDAGHRLVLSVDQRSDAVRFYERLGWRPLKPLRLDLDRGRRLDLLVLIKPADGI